MFRCQSSTQGEPKKPHPTTLKDRWLAMCVQNATARRVWSSGQLRRVAAEAENELQEMHPLQVAALKQLQQERNKQ
jgi:hypothetical protein